MVVKVYWSCKEPGSSVELHGYSWMGWMAKAPADWDGIMEALEAHAPEGSSVKKAAWMPSSSGSDQEPPFSIDLMFPRKPSGQGAPWLPSEESQYRVEGCPRICFVDLHWEFESEIPREFSQDWHDQMSARALDSVKEFLEASLSRLGFGELEFMGVRQDIAGSNHWSNVAEELGPSWSARVLRKELEDSVPESKKNADGKKSGL